MKHPILTKDVPIVLPPSDYIKQLQTVLAPTAHCMSHTTITQGIRSNTFGDKASLARQTFSEQWPHVLTQGLDNAKELFTNSFIITSANGRIGITANGTDRELATLIAEVMSTDIGIHHIIRMAIKLYENK